MDLRWQSLAKGAASFFHPAFRSSWHVEDRYQPEFFYQIFMRHYLHVAPRLAQQEHFVLAELGPGDTIGSGLTGLLAGADRYVALDIEYLIDVDRNLATFDAIVKLFEERRAPSNAGAFADLFPPAQSTAFPEALVKTFSWSMAPDRLAAIRADIETLSGRFIDVHVPWRQDAIPPGSVDWLMTHAVLEHVDDIDDAYTCFAAWLKPDGVMSHMVDFFSHGLTKNWNGHWAISDLAWRVMRGKRYWLINRLPLSEHLGRMERRGSTVVEKLLSAGPPGLDPSHFAPRFRTIPDQDARTRMAFLVSTR